ncbi:bifunctional [glutamine synthetase] adenylyltransferase/[glutamine synthetase]-adenylyl-L-tyrosine phosphorylase [Protofrankia symbiont of Coriaria ruscifolia]|uniref:bifunctional [glutamine synthetase] adenylyltransferase/[glutamine synthetase]-adenylyl-L-tyrosine phosphorylase n=1 Tax=Protofrankia symbiont of Coriaria ruscifolia TaxID=1306542 RepID=UPI001041B7BC|nr:bifunctional [glutamine synthetase] adenylyltransferase/[glutamine synthetase]-adenylyl-L-tyrosine phosphorylase [Protofrankia symbiont of Coriaria ruscifolia]
MHGDPGATHPRGSSVQAQLARMGFSNVDRFAVTIRRLGLVDHDDEHPAGAAGAGMRVAAPSGVTDLYDNALLAELAQAANPDLALAAIERIAESAPEAVGRELLAVLDAQPGLRARLVAVLGASTALGDHLVRHPGDWRVLADDSLMRVPPDASLTRGQLLRAVGADPDAPLPRAAGDGTDVLDALRVAYRRALMVLAARDLTGAVAFDDATAELADLAAAALDAALAVARSAISPSAPPVRLAVIGMGKCGGRELNYVSDVDVLFVAEPGHDDDHPVMTRSEETAALGTATSLAVGMVRACGTVTSEGALFQVDVGLRPEGRDGPLVRTLASHDAYYRRWARTWEFQALLKARPVAGDREVGERLCAAVRPLVWSAASRPGFVTDVRSMRRRVERSLPRADADRDLKLGPGGLRDVEFAVQLLQLVHGRTDPKLHTAATLSALDALARGGYVGRRDAAGLADAYRFLRGTEHRLQLQRLRRVHTLPRDPAEMRWLARSLGLATAERMEAEHARVARFVRRLHERLFYQPLLEAVARLSAEEVRLTPAEARDRLAALGFADTARALRHIEALTNGVSRTATIQRRLLPAMLHWFADAADPDAGLLAYRQVSEALGHTPWYLRLLRDESGAAERLSRLLAASTYVADLMQRAPESVRLLRTTGDLQPSGREQLVRALIAIARRNPVREQAVVRARAVRRVELIRVACADLLGLLDVAAVGRALSDAATATIEAALFIAQRRFEQEAGRPVPARIAVIAMGRLGGGELSYGSDADVVFVHEPAEESTNSAVTDSEVSDAARMVVAELLRLLALPAGGDPPLILDAQLRPEGRTGPMTRTLASYAAYFNRWSQGWEAQALLRARPVAGDAALGERFCSWVDKIRYPSSLRPGVVAEVVRLRGRMEAERIPAGVDHTLHLKLGPGGLADVEWAVQVLQLRHAHRVPALRTTSTLAGLRAAAATGLLDPGEAATLTQAWTMASRIRNAIMLARGRPGDVLPRQPRALAQVAGAVGYPADRTDALVSDYRRVGAHARAVVEAVFARELDRRELDGLDG